MFCTGHWHYTLWIDSHSLWKTMTLFCRSMCCMDGNDIKLKLVSVSRGKWHQWDPSLCNKFCWQKIYIHTVTYCGGQKHHKSICFMQCHWRQNWNTVTACGGQWHHRSMMFHTGLCSLNPKQSQPMEVYDTTEGEVFHTGGFVVNSKLYI